ncbi:MAG: sigma-70 family RNA polymerase sigma factor [Anaerolineae bacterium]
MTKGAALSHRSTRRQRQGTRGRPAPGGGPRRLKEAELPSEAWREEPAADDHPDSDVQSDLVRVYLQEIGRVPLLEPEQERELAAAIREGQRALKRLQQGDFQEQEREGLQALVQQGKQAERRLVQANLRLVVSVARRFRLSGLPFSDLVQEGNLGLLRAAQKYDPNRGYRFSTYATWWIRQAISRYIADHARTIRIPAHMVDTLSRLGRAQRRMAQALGEEPSLEQLACAIGLLSEHDLEAIEGAAREGQDLPPDLKVRWRRALLKMRRILQASQDSVSLELPVGAEQEGSLADLLMDENVEAPVEAASRHLLQEQVQGVLEELSERERKVLEMRFGLLDGQAYTLEEVGNALGVTRERIRQIEAKALRKLRHPHRRRKLKDFL